MICRPGLTPAAHVWDIDYWLAGQLLFLPRHQQLEHGHSHHHHNQQHHHHSHCHTLQITTTKARQPPLFCAQQSLDRGGGGRAAADWCWQGHGAPPTDDMLVRAHARCSETEKIQLLVIDGIPGLGPYRAGEIQRVLPAVQ